MTDDERAAPRPDPDPGDPAVAAALARTRADLAAHGAGAPPMPPGLLGDIDRALAAERPGAATAGTAGTAGTAEAAGSAPVPLRRRRVAVAALAVAAVAAAVAVVIATVVPGGGAPRLAPTAAPPPPDTPSLSGGDGVSALRAGLGRDDYGPLGDDGRLAGCLAAHGVPAGTRPAGARQVVVDGRPGVLLVLPTGVAARFRLLVVEPGCGPGAPLTVSDTLVGR